MNLSGFGWWSHGHGYMPYIASLDSISDHTRISFPHSFPTLFNRFFCTAWTSPSDEISQWRCADDKNVQNVHKKLFGRKPWLTWLALLHWPPTIPLDTEAGGWWLVNIIGCVRVGPPRSPLTHTGQALHGLSRVGLSNTYTHQSATIPLDTSSQHHWINWMGHSHCLSVSLLAPYFALVFDLSFAFFSFLWAQPKPAPSVSICRNTRHPSKGV